MLTDRTDSCNIIQVARSESEKHSSASLDWQGIVSDCFRVLTKKKISKKFLTSQIRCDKINESLEATGTSKEALNKIVL